MGRDATAAILVNYRTAPRTLRAVRELRAAAPELDVVVVDNGGQERDWLAAELPDCAVVATPRNLGYSGGVNLGVAAALERGARRLLLLNSDARLAPDALPALEAALAGPKVGIAGPALLFSQEPDRLESLGLSWCPRSGRMRELARNRSYAALRKRDPHAVSAVSGCVMLLSAAAWEAAGPLDERFFFYFEDLDLCLRARDAGIEVVCVPAARAFHDGAATIGSRNPVRHYYAARNNLLLSRARAGSGLRQASIAAWNLVLATRQLPRLGPGVLAWTWLGLWHHRQRRYGAAPASLLAP